MIPFVYYIGIYLEVAKLLTSNRTIEKQLFLNAIQKRLLRITAFVYSL